MCATQVKRQDVFIVSNWEVIQWMQRPTPLQQMDSFLPWNTCGETVPPEHTACNIPRVCKETLPDIVMAK